MNRLLKFASVASTLTSRISLAQAENEISEGGTISETTTIDSVAENGLVPNSSNSDTDTAATTENSVASEEDENQVTSETDQNILDDPDTDTTNGEAADTEGDAEIPVCTGEEEEGVECKLPECTGEEEEGVECVEPEPVLPEDLTIGKDELRWIGWYLPTMCDHLEVGSVTAVFCPELRYLMNTQEILVNSMANTENYLDTNQDLLEQTVYSMSKETEHDKDLIFIINKNEVWRISAVVDELGNNIVTRTLIFKLKILQKVVSIDVYDVFAFIVFEDQSAFIVIRPDEEGDFGSYNTFISDLDSDQRSTLDFTGAPIQYYAVVEDNSKNYDFIMNVLTKDSSGRQFLSQEGVVFDAETRTILFKTLRSPIDVTLNDRTISDIQMNSFILVVGYADQNNGNGRVEIFDTNTLISQHVVDGSEDKRGVGKSVQIQEDPNSNGYRIWYTTNEKLISASYNTYDGQDSIFEDEIQVYEVNNIGGTLDSNVGQFNNNFLYSSVRNGATTMDLYSISACPSNTQLKFVDGKANQECVVCGDDLFSTGFTPGCQECSFWQRFNSPTSYKKNIIDKECEYEVVVDNPEKEDTIDSLTDITNQNIDPNEPDEDTEVIVVPTPTPTPSPTPTPTPTPNPINPTITDPIIDKGDRVDVDTRGDRVTSVIVEDSSDSTPIVIAVAVVVLLIATILSFYMIIKGACCDCVYQGKTFEKFKKQQDPAKSARSGDNQKEGSDQKDSSNYASMSKSKGKDGKKNVYEAGTAQPSMLNFDITGEHDVTNDAPIDIEAATAKKVVTTTPAKNIPLHSARGTSARGTSTAPQTPAPHRNSTTGMFIDQNLAVTDDRVSIVLTQGQDDKEKFRNGKAQKALDDHVRKSSHLTQPKVPTNGGQPIEEIGEESLQSFQFSGSQFKAPSDAAADNKKAQEELDKKNQEQLQIANQNSGQNSAANEDENNSEWMYEDTIQEEFDD